MKLSHSPLVTSWNTMHRIIQAACITGILSMTACKKAENASEAAKPSQPSISQPAIVSLADMPGRIAAQKAHERTIQESITISDVEYAQMQKEYTEMVKAGIIGPNMDIYNQWGKVVWKPDLVETVVSTKRIMALVDQLMVPLIGKTLSTPPRNRQSLNDWAFLMLEKYLADPQFLQMMKQIVWPELTQEIDCQERATVYAHLWCVGDAYLEAMKQPKTVQKLQLIWGVLHDPLAPSGAAHLWVEILDNQWQATILDPSMFGPDGKDRTLTGGNNWYVGIGGFEARGAVSFRGQDATITVTGHPVSRLK